MNQQPNAAKILAGQIHNAAAEVYEQLSAKADRARKTGVTSDDLSASIMDFLDEVEVVRDLPGGVPLAFDLVMTLAEHSYGGLDGGGSGYGERPSDPEVDRLISELVVERRQMEPSWNHEGALESIEYQNKYLREYGINGFCSGSIKLLSGWEKAAPTVVDLTIIHESGRDPSPGEELSYCEAWLYRQ